MRSTPGPWERSLPRPIYHNNNDSDLAYIPHEWDYAQITAPPSAVTATTEGTAVAQITGNSVTYDGGRVKVEVYVPQITASTGGTTATLVLLRDTTVLGHVPFQYITGAGTGGNIAVPVKGEAFDTPTAAAHTYSVAMYVNANNATVQAGAGGSGNLVPAYLRITSAKLNP